MSAETLAFGRLLRQIRIAAGLTQEALAERTGLGVRSIQHLEGGAHLPHRETIGRLVRVLGLTGEEQSQFERLAKPAPRTRERATGPRVPQSDHALRHNLPAQLTSFIGRERELAEVRRLLGATRLLTVTGAGGTGKTRFALRLASDLLDAHPDGVWFIDLAPLIDPAFVPAAIATAIGIPEQTGQSILKAALQALRTRRTLLLLDNCEHLIDACAQLADALLRACADVHILATSREALGVAGEIAWPLPSLALPPANWPVLDSAGGVDALGEFAAIRLFVERAGTANPRFQFTQEDAPSILQICRAVDGIPLAIELAAARVRVFSARWIAARLNDLPHLLTGGSRTAPARQQTLQTTIDWSYSLLTEPERLLFRRLAVFAGSCSDAAIAGICDDTHHLTFDALPDLLTRLVDRSLLVVEWGQNERYRLLEPLRQYALDRLGQAGEVEMVRDRHSAWYLALAERAKPELIGPQQVEWLDRLEIDRANYRVALERLIDHGPAELSLRLAAALWRFWFVRDALREGWEWLTRALALPAAPSPTALRAEVLDGAGEIAFHLENNAAAERLGEESLAIYQALGASRGIAWALRTLAQAAVSQGDASRAEELGMEALARARETGDSWVVAQVLSTLVYAAAARQDILLARTRAEESLALFRELGDLRAIALELRHLGGLACDLNDDIAARAHLQEARTIFSGLGSRGWLGVTTLMLAIQERNGGNYRQAQALIEDGLAAARQCGDRELIGDAVFHLASLARAAGDLDQAEKGLRESLAVFRESGFTVAAAVALGFCGVVAIARGASHRGVRLLGAAGPDVVRAVWLGSDDRQVYQESLTTARARLDEADFATAWAEGQAMTLEQAIANALAGADVEAEGTKHRLLLHPRE